MRTTVDLPPAVLERVRGIAADRRTSISRVIAGFVEAGLEGPPVAPAGRLEFDPRTGFTVLRLPGVITSADVRAAEDEDDA
jgi:hypothetical protein